jgi:hypothetical protein
MYDLNADWFNWYVNNKPLGNKTFSEIVNEDGYIKSVKIIPETLPKYVGNVREESELYLDKIISSCKLKKFAVLISGIDSEIIARYLNKKKLDVKLYHIKFWFKNDDDTNLIKQISKELNVPYKIINYDYKDDKQSMIEILNISLQPASVKNTFLHAISKIEKDRYIFCGVRNFEKNAVQNLCSFHKPFFKDTNKKLFYIDTRQIIGRNTLNLLKRKGCSVFWFNDSRTTSSMLRDKRTIFKQNGEIDNDKIFKDLWKNECVFKQKTNPFVGGTNKYKWENWFNGHWRSRSRALVFIQRRYLRKKYGIIKNVCDDIIKGEADNSWIFGASIDLNKIL